MQETRGQTPACKPAHQPLILVLPAAQHAPAPRTHLAAAAHVQHFMEVQVIAALEDAGALARLVPHVRGRGGALQVWVGGWWGWGWGWVSSTAQVKPRGWGERNGR